MQNQSEKHDIFQKMVKIYTLFQNKTIQKPGPLSIPIYIIIK